jgi:glycosyltransferase involved in cell wall biosynthesis
MRTLVLAGESPLPPRFGLRLRVLYLSRELARSAGVDVAVWGDVPPAADEPFTLSGLARDWGRPRRGWGRMLWEPWEVAIPRGRPLERYAAQRRWDTVVAHTLPLLRPARQARAPVILDAHNLMTGVMRTLASADSRRAHRWFWRFEALKTSAFERHVARQVDAVCVPSEREAATLESWGARCPVVVPNGVDVEAIDYAPPPPGARLLYVGHYGWRPNVEGALELVASILPRVRAAIPEAELVLVGGRPPAELVARAAPGAGTGVRVTGEVEDVLPQLREARVLVVPLRCGGGTRLKVLEALAAGTPVVATPFAVAGLGLQDGRHVLTADAPADIADLTLAVIRDDALARRLSEEGRALVRRRFGWSVVAQPLLEVNERLAHGARAGRGRRPRPRAARAPTSERLAGAPEPPPVEVEAQLATPVAHELAGPEDRHGRH